MKPCDPESAQVVMGKNVDILQQEQNHLEAKLEELKENYIKLEVTFEKLQNYIEDINKLKKVRRKILNN